MNLPGPPPQLLAWGDGLPPGSGEPQTGRTLHRGKVLCLCWAPLSRVWVAGKQSFLDAFLHYNFYYGCHFLSALWKDVFASVTLGSKYKLGGEFRGKVSLVLKIIKLCRLLSFFK